MQKSTTQEPLPGRLADIDVGLSRPAAPRQRGAGTQTASDRRLRSAFVRAGSQEIGRLTHAMGQAAEAAAGITASPPEGSHDPVLLVPRWHFAMLNDTERNEALAKAISEVVRPGDLVLDIGAGTGLLAMLAARAGAARVVSCEANPLLAEIAQQVVDAHDLSDVVKVVPAYSNELRLGPELTRPADVIVSEIVDCGLIGEGILPTMRDARTRLLAPGGRLLPGRARLLGALCQSETIHQLNRVETALDFDVSLMNAVATAGHQAIRVSAWPHTLLGEPTLLADFDFVGGPLDEGSAKIAAPVQRSGIAHGVVAWFEMDLTPGVTLSNPPDNVRSHWEQAFIPFDQPRAVTAEEEHEFTLRWSDTQLFIA